MLRPNSKGQSTSPTANIFAPTFLQRTSCTAMDHLPIRLAHTVLNCTKATSERLFPKLRSMDVISPCANLLRSPQRNRSPFAMTRNQVNRYKSTFHRARNRPRLRRRHLLRLPRPLLHLG